MQVYLSANNSKSLLLLSYSLNLVSTRLFMPVARVNSYFPVIACWLHLQMNRLMFADGIPFSFLFSVVHLRINTNLLYRMIKHR